MTLSNEVSRVRDRGLPCPSFDVLHIDYDDIIITSGRYQVRRVNIDEDIILTNQIENQGLKNPIVLMPFGETGKYVPVSGHTRYKSCHRISIDSQTRAIELGIDKGIPAYVYSEEISDLRMFNNIADALNDHEQSNPIQRADLVDQCFNMYGSGEFRCDDMSVDHKDMLEYLMSKGLDNFSKKALSGVVQSVASTVQKTIRMEDFTEGSIKSFPNKKHLNGRLFQQFGISDNTSPDHYVETDDGITSFSIRGIKPSNSQWVGEQLSSFAAYIRELEDHNIVPDERILYWHVTDIIDCGDDCTAQECLNRTRRGLVSMANKMSRVYQSKYIPTKIGFIPQFQLDVDAQGNEVFGEEINLYEM